MANTEEAVVEPAAPCATPISFGFTRTSVRRRLAAMGDGTASAPEEKDFLKTVEGRELQSVKPVQAPKELIIPLIQNGYRRQPVAQMPVQSTEALGDGVLSQAVKELIEESKKSLEERENSGVDPTFAIPMIQKGYTPNEEGAGNEPQAETVPEEADYEAVPVEAFGLAMLRGMGWKPGEGVGCTFSQVVQPRVNSLRLKGLGLGADLAEAQALTSSGPYCPPRPDGEQGKGKEDQPQGLVPGGAVVVLSGPHRGLCGKVEGLDPDNARAVVRLAVGSRVVTVSEYCLRPVSQQKFDNSVRSSRTSRSASGQHGVASLSQKALQREDLQGRRERSERKRKHPSNRQEGPVAKSEKAARRSRRWLRRDLRVRFVDRLHKGGLYYNTKMTVEDVPSPDTCVCRTDEGRILEGLKEDMLETVVPKVEGSRVMVVLGPLAGRVGHLRGQDRAQGRASVQLRREHRLVELHYDAVCQYMGPGDSDEG